jgi:hypothetical protein
LEGDYDRNYFFFFLKKVSHGKKIGLYYSKQECFEEDGGILTLLLALNAVPMTLGFISDHIILPCSSI